MACRSGWSTTVKNLLKHTSKSFSINHETIKHILLSSNAKHLDVIWELVSAGMNKEFLLVKACQFGNFKAVQLLLDAKASPLSVVPDDICDGLSTMPDSIIMTTTALNMACKMGYHSIVRSILRTQTTSCGTSILAYAMDRALVVAVVHGNIAVTQELLDASWAGPRNKLYLSHALNFAWGKGCMQIAHKLVEAGAIVDQEHREDAFRRATRQGRPDIVSHIISYCCDSSIGNKEAQNEAQALASGRVIRPALMQQGTIMRDALEGGSMQLIKLIYSAFRICHHNDDMISKVDMLLMAAAALEGPLLENNENL